MSNGIKDLREFGKFRLDAAKRVLWFEGEPVDLPLKEIELLCVLTENGGEVVTKEELLDSVWRDSFVDEGNLSRRIHVLRKTLKELGESENLIKTVPRRGYRFTGELRRSGASELLVEKHTKTRLFVEETPVRTASKARFAALIVLLIVAVGLPAFFFLRTSAKPPLADVKSVGVLPLKNLDGSDDTNALNLGLREMLAANVGGANGPAVFTVNSENADSDPLAIGRKLGVDSVLLGSTQENAGKVRVNLRLLSVSSGEQLWAASFDEASADLFKLQDAISVQVVNSLNVSPTHAEKTERRTANAEAYKAYLRGRLFFDRRNIESYGKAIAEYRRALQIDPVYSPAFSGMADAYSLLANNSSGRKKDEYYVKAKEAALRAIELDEDLSEAHASLGWIMRTHEWDWAGAEKSFDRAIELNPKNANAHRWRGLLLTGLGRTKEGIAELKTAHEIDPLSLVITSHLGWMNFFAKNYDEAIFHFRQNLEIDPNHLPSRRLLIGTLSQLGRHDEVLREIETFPDTPENQHHISILKAVTLFQQGSLAESRTALDNAAEQFRDDSSVHYYLATAYANIGEPQKALDHLERALEARDDRMVWVKVQPDFETLRQEPRYREILREMNLGG